MNPGNPSSPDDVIAGEASLRTQVDIVWEDLRRRYAAGERPNVEEYFRRFPALLKDDEAAVDVIYFDFLMRREVEESIQPAECLAQFPQYAEPLKRQFAVFAALETDAAAAGTERLLVDPLHSTGPRSAEDESGPGDAHRSADDTSSDRFQLIEEVGRGGMGVVYKALQTDLNRLVALKLILAGPHADEQLLRRFQSEGEAVAKLQHPNIVQIHEIGQREQRPFLSLEFIDGGSLHKKLGGKSLDAMEAAELIEKLAHAVEYAHRRGVVHRDLKPANVLLQDGDLATPKITDFGLAKQTEFEGGRTRTGDIVGTPSYMAPEQAAGPPDLVGPAADVYALGAILFETLTGRPPFGGDTLIETLDLVRAKPAPSPRRLRDNVPRDLDTICLKCLQKEPADRYASAGALAEELKRFRSGQPILARPIGVGEKVWKWAKRHPAIAVLTAVTLLVLGFFAGAALQLQAVRTAEREKTQLLGDSYFASGQLAMQRGQFGAALRLFDLSLEQGFADRAAVRVMQIESHFVLRQFHQAENLLAALEARPTSSNVAGQVSLWKAELALHPSSDDGARRHYEQALSHRLPRADQIYVTGMLSERSNDAVSQFRDALQVDPFHHRARTMLVNLLVFLGRLDEAESQATFGQQLFPEDPYFVLMEGFVLAARGDLEKSLATLDRLQLSEAHRQAWISVYKLIDDIVAAASQARSLTPQVGSRIAASVLSEQESLTTVAEFGLRFPPALGGKVAELNARLAADDRDRLRSLLEELLRTHEEGALYLWLGEYEIDDAYGDGNQPDGDSLQSARDAFVAAMEAPSLLRNHEHAARLGVIGTSSYLGAILHRDRAGNVALAANALRELDSTRDYSAQVLRALTLVAFEAEDAELCRVWLKRWAAAANSNPIEILKYRMEVELVDRRYDAALEACDKLLEAAPNNADALNNRIWAKYYLNQSLSQAAVEVGAVNWEGSWRTTSGVMQLTQTGDVVKGQYTHDDGKFSGVASGRVLTGRWSEAPTYDPTKRDAGRVQLIMSEDGQSFVGKWRYGFEGPLTGNWRGQRQIDKTDE